MQKGVYLLFSGFPLFSKISTSKVVKHQRPIEIADLTFFIKIFLSLV